MENRLGLVIPVGPRLQKIYFPPVEWVVWSLQVSVRVATRSVAAPGVATSPTSCSSSRPATAISSFAKGDVVNLGLCAEF
jgi:hypothetical protein